MRVETDQIRTLAIVGVLFAGFAVGLWWPAHNQRKKLHERADIAQRQLGIDAPNTQQLSRLYTHVLDLRQQVQGVHRQVPGEEEIAYVLRGISEAAKNNEIVGQEVQMRDTVAYVDYSVIELDVQVAGKYRQIIGLLKDIEALPRLVRIDELEIESSARRPNDPLRARIRLSTFFAPQQGGDQ